MRREIKWQQLIYLLVISVLLGGVLTSYLEYYQQNLLMPVRNLIVLGQWERYDDNVIGATQYRQGVSGVNPVHVAQIVRPLVLSVLYEEVDSGNVSEENLDKLIEVTQFFLDTGKLKEYNDLEYLVWYYDFDYPTYQLSAPWLSGMAQGFVIDTLLAAYKVTGESDYLAAARLAGNTFYVPVEREGVSIFLEEGIWFEEYAQAGVTYPMVLNGHNFAVLSLWHLCIQDSSYCDAFEQGVVGLTELLPRFDVGIWSQYDLLGLPANSSYQRIHVEQLEELAHITGEEIFLRYAKKFRLQLYMPFGVFYRLFVTHNRFLVSIFLLNSSVVFMIILFWKKRVKSEQGVESSSHLDRVLHFTSAHSASDIRIFHKESKTLHRAGYTVILVVPDKRDAQTVEGIHIRTVAIPNSRFYRFTCTAWQIYRAAWAENADVYHLHDSELFLIGFLLRLRGKKVIYDVHEDLPKSIRTKYWVPNIFRSIISRAAEALEWAAAQAFSGIVAATPSIAERFPDEKTVTVQNFPILGELSQDDDLSPYNERPNHIVYMGGITQRRGAIQMVEAMALLPQYLSAHLVLAGSFRPSDLIHELESLPGWQAVDFLGWISRQEMRVVFQDTRIGFVLFHPAPNHVEAQPNKLFEFMSAGIPIVASNFPLWREMIERVGCGLVVAPLDSHAIADAVQWLFEHPEEAEAMGRRGKKAVETLYNWEIESRKLVNFYEALLQ